jgi:hypothetical protein
MARKRRNQIDEQFVAHRLSMIESPAYAALSHSGLRVLTRLEIEHCHHGGAENGNLIVTFGDFEFFGIHRRSIAPGLRECEALGFLETVQRGRPGTSNSRRPSVYRLTYLHSKTSNPTNEWRGIKSQEDADRIAREARDARSAGALYHRRQPRTSEVL